MTPARCIALAIALASLGSHAGQLMRGAVITPPCFSNHFILNEPLACWDDAEPLHVPRAGHTATLLLDGRLLVAGGGGDAGTSAEIYDPSSGRWTLAAPLPLSRAGHTATLLLDGRVLILGGHETYIAPSWPEGAMAPTGPQVLNDDTGDIYDPVADTWTSIRGPLTPRDYFSATRLADGRVLVVGGIGDSDDSLGSCELYDPATGEWSETGSLPKPYIHYWVQYWKRWGHTATLLPDGRVLIAGGFDDETMMNVVPEAFVYEPATGLWTAAGTLGDARGYHTATLLVDGRVMVSGGDRRGCRGDGGYCTEVTLATTEIYDPRENAWATGPQLLRPRSSHTATSLRDGSTLLIGGYRSVGAIPNFSIAELRDAEASSAPDGAWVSAPSPVIPRDAYTATLLRDGSVLVVGGASRAPPYAPLTSVEMYRPPGASAP